MFTLKLTLNGRLAGSERLDRIAIVISVL